MNKFTNPLNNITIASPCSADWDTMVGDERKRFCGECKLNVYNLSGMSKKEAEHLIADSEGRLCVRFYKRSDGTILTKDCPVGWQAVKQRVSKMAAACASLVFGVLSGLGLTAFFSQSNEERLMGEVAYQSTPKPKATPKDTPERPLMGAVAIPRETPKETPKPKATPENVKIGKMVYIPPKKEQQTEKDMAALIEKVKAQGE